MPQLNDLSRSLVTLEQDATLIAVIEMGQSSWLVAGIVPGVERSPLKKLAVDESALLKLLNRWREEAEKAGHRIERIAIAFEAGRDGFWLARWLRYRRAIVLLFLAAGFEWHDAGCSLCTALNGDLLAEHERCASTSNRNFRGRQGRNGRTHLLSPAMAAAAAITGRLTDVRKL